jgi:hypothetical protein
MGDVDTRTYDLISGAGMESILMPRKQFVKEHKNLLKVLKKGDPKALKKEYADQKKELTEQLKGGAYSFNDLLTDGAVILKEIAKLGLSLTGDTAAAVDALAEGVAGVPTVMGRLKQHWKEGHFGDLLRYLDTLQQEASVLPARRGRGIAEDKRYINSKTPYTLANEMTMKMLNARRILKRSMRNSRLRS